MTKLSWHLDYGISEGQWTIQLFFFSCTGLQDALNVLCSSVILNLILFIFLCKAFFLYAFHKSRLR